LNPKLHYSPTASTFAVPAKGQAFGWDPTNPDQICMILKRTREIIVGRVAMPH